MSSLLLFTKESVMDVSFDDNIDPELSDMVFNLEDLFEDYAGELVGTDLDFPYDPTRESTVLSVEHCHSLDVENWRRSTGTFAQPARRESRLTLMMIRRTCPRMRKSSSNFCYTLIRRRSRSQSTPSLRPTSLSRGEKIFSLARPYFRKVLAGEKYLCTQHTVHRPTMCHDSE
jgi:hypothetical protein